MNLLFSILNVNKGTAVAYYNKKFKLLFKTVYFMLFINNVEP